MRAPQMMPAIKTTTAAIRKGDLFSSSLSLERPATEFLVGLKVSFTTSNLTSLFA